MVHKCGLQSGAKVGAQQEIWRLQPWPTERAWEAAGSQLLSGAHFWGRDAGLQGVVPETHHLPKKLWYFKQCTCSRPGPGAAPPHRGPSGGQSFQTRTPCFICDSIPVSKVLRTLLLCG